MQNSEQEEQSWFKFYIILMWMSFPFLLEFLLRMGSGGKETELNFDNSSTILVLKIMQGVSAILFFIVPSLLIAQYWTKAKLSYLGIKKIPSLSSLFIASTGMLLALPLINRLAEVNSKMQLPSSFGNIERWMQNSEAKAEELTKAFTAGTSIDVLILNIVVIALIAAMSEEFFFRGLLQKVLMECFKNKHIAVWTAAVIFSAFHMQFYGFLPRMLMGAYLGYLFLWSGSLWVSIMAHFANNGMAVLFMWLANRGTISTDVDTIGTGGDMEWIPVLISSVMVVSSLVLIYKTEVKQTNV
jgi:membrane protease YdiL (CAAX protease family)